jgi:hypothetical protein
MHPDYKKWIAPGTEPLSDDFSGPRKNQLTKRSTTAVVVHSERKMKSYLVLDSELNHISTQNLQVSLFFSLMCTCASTAFGLWSSMLIDSSPSEMSQKLLPVLEYALLGAAAIFGTLGGLAFANKQSEVHRIMRESDTG